MGDILAFPWRDAVYGERERREQAEAAGNIYRLAGRLNLKQKEQGEVVTLPCDTEVPFEA